MLSIPMKSLVLHSQPETSAAFYLHLFQIPKVEFLLLFKFRMVLKFTSIIWLIDVLPDCFVPYYGKDNALGVSIFIRMNYLSCKQNC